MERNLEIKASARFDRAKQVLMLTVELLPPTSVEHDELKALLAKFGEFPEVMLSSSDVLKLDIFFNPQILLTYDAKKPFPLFDWSAFLRGCLPPSPSDREEPLSGQPTEQEKL